MPHWHRYIGALVAVLGAGVLPTVAGADTSPSAAGQPGYFLFDTHQIGPNTSADVNLINGSLLVSEQDLTSDPSTYNLAYARYYNSISGGSTELGPGWSLSVGPDVSLTVGASSAQLVGPNGYRISFSKNSDGSFSGPLTFEGSLTANTDGTYTLAQPSQSDTLTFDGQGNLSQVADGAGNVFTVQDTSAAGKTVLSSYGTASGRRINVSYDGNSRVREIDDSASNHRYYTYNSQGQLASYQGPAATESYGYDANGHLNSITLPDGSTLRTVNLPNGQVSSLTTHSSDGSPDGTTSYSYARGSTTVTYPDGSQQTYSYDGNGNLAEDSSVDQAAVDYYSATQNISAAQAEAQLQLQDKAAPLDSLLTGQLGDQYVGMWFDQTSGRIKVGVGPSGSQQTVSHDFQQAGISSNAEIVRYRASYADLTQAQPSIESQLADLVTEGTVRIGIAPDHDAVQIEVDNDITPAQQLRVQQAQSAATVPTSILQSSEDTLVASPTDSCDHSLCNRPLRGGQHIDTPAAGGGTSNCSAGFIARSNSDNGPYVLTAGHCVVEAPGIGSTWYSAIPQDDVNGIFPFSRRAIGPAHSGYFGGTGRLDGGATPPRGDAGLITIASNSYWNFKLQPLVVVYGTASFGTTRNVRYHILGTGRTPANWDLRRQHFVVCTGGAPLVPAGGTPTPVERCGLVKAVNVDPHYDHGPDPKGLAQFDACGKYTHSGILPGASGSPVYKHNIAYGVISGAGGCTAFYQGIGSAQRILGVHILTG